MKDLFFSWLNKRDRHGRTYGEYLIFALIIVGITLFYIVVGPLLCGGGLTMNKLRGPHTDTESSHSVERLSTLATGAFASNSSHDELATPLGPVEGHR